jgi:hypothetical protein
MYKILNMTAAIAMLAFAGTGGAQARTVNHHKRHHSGYAATVHSHGRACGQVGSASDMPDSKCSNSWRIND